MEESLKNYWNDDKRVLKAENEALKDEITYKTIKSKNNTNINNQKIDSLNSKTSQKVININSNNNKENEIDYLFLNIQIFLHIFGIFSILINETLSIIMGLFIILNFCILWIYGIYKIFTNTKDKTFWLLCFIFIPFIAVYVYPLKNRNL